MQPGDEQTTHRMPKRDEPIRWATDKHKGAAAAARGNGDPMLSPDRSEPAAEKQVSVPGGPLVCTREVERAFDAAF
jgi:hypothetical protein